MLVGRNAQSTIQDIPLNYFVIFPGLMSVFGQQLDYVSSALKVLDKSSNNQYGIRGQPRFDKVQPYSHCFNFLLFSSLYIT